MKEIEDVILFQLDQTTKQAKLYSQREFDQAGLNITVEQWVLLKIIHESNEMTQIELAQKSLRDPASITRTLDLLEKKGFIQRLKIVGNRRQYHLRLTSNGETFIKNNFDMVKSHRMLSVKGFTSKELKELKSMLKRIQDNMR